MSASAEQSLRVMAAAIMKLQAQVHAQDLLLQALFGERALQRGTFPQEAAEEVLALAEFQDAATVDDEPSQHVEDVQAAIRAFAMGLRGKLEERQDQAFL